MNLSRLKQLRLPEKLQRYEIVNNIQSIQGEYRQGAMLSTSAWREKGTTRPSMASRL